MTHQIFIASYRGDFAWLRHCLVSLHRFASGWLPPVVCVASDDLGNALVLAGHYCPEAVVVVEDGRPGQGFMRAQVGMMKADLHCPDADVIYLMGSDCIALRELRPETYCMPDGRPIVLMNRYEHVGNAKCWRPGVERLLGFTPEWEYMRRIPSVFPRAIFAPMRSAIATRACKLFEDAIYEGDINHLDTSEANLLGAYAHKWMPDSCAWFDRDPVYQEGANPPGMPSAIGQMWSRGGLDYPADNCFEYDFRGERRCATGRTPRQIIADVLYDGDTGKLG